ncbi:hypothetical protein Poly41_08100 [Novipirellula artificiosorum]|uniref:Uncharacterized protein n=1 Tax=Novipirellula artificiosorum TaxID=2528016 RepID=A0A5C6DYK1_9BACT|nr:hypothetical protein Poly41_08100 [Novipirellula artificiosorum]
MTPERWVVPDPFRRSVFNISAPSFLGDTQETVTSSGRPVANAAIEYRVKQPVGGWHLAYFILTAKQTSQRFRANWRTWIALGFHVSTVCCH